MKISKRKSIYSDLNKFDPMAKDDDFIEVTEWTNGEGYDISINDRHFNLTCGEIDAINFLVKTLEHNIDLNDE